MNNKRITGKILAKLLELYVDAINEGAVPNITSAWESVVDHEREKFFQKAKSNYVHQIKQLNLPMDDSEQLKILFKLRHQAYDTMREGFKLDDETADQHEQELKMKELEVFINQHERDAQKSNEVISKKI